MGRIDPEAWERAQGILSHQRCIVQHNCIVFALNGDRDAAALLEQLFFWASRTTDPDGWIFKTEEEWKNEIFLTRNQLERARILLRAAGLVEFKRKRTVAMSNPYHYRVTDYFPIWLDGAVERYAAHLALTVPPESRNPIIPDLASPGLWDDGSPGDADSPSPTLFREYEAESTLTTSAPLRGTAAADPPPPAKRRKRKVDRTIVTHDETGRVIYTPEFDEFWKEWGPSHPRARGLKAQTFETYQRLTNHSRNGPLVEAILRGVKLWNDSHDWRKQNGKWKPMPETFLNNARWNVEEGELRPWAGEDGEEEVESLDDLATLMVQRTRARIGGNGTAPTIEAQFTVLEDEDPLGDYP